MFEVQHRLANGDWENTWHTYHPFDGEKPMYFDTREDALCELALFFDALKDAVERGGMSEDHGYRPEDFRIVETEEQVS